MTKKEKQYRDMATANAIMWLLGAAVFVALALGGAR